MNRPQGVTILGWVAIVFGALGLVVAVMAVFAGIALLALGAGAVGVGGVAGGASLAGGAFMVLALAIWTAVLSAVEIAFGVGALQLKPWAWTLGMIWTWVSVVTNVVSVFASRSGVVSAIIGILVAIAILYYLYTDEVKVAFGKTDQAAPGFMVPVFEQIDKMLASRKPGS
jgi:ABC-type antimicrobial peptide transport system permease subunit